MSAHDPGLHAVARVRSVRERDSRLGLQQALREQRAGEQRVQDAEEAERSQEGFAAGDLAAFIAVRQSQAALAHACATARGDLDGARRLSLDAGARWRSDSSRLAAVEDLLDRRALERAAESALVEAKELDEVAGRLWLRGQEDA